MTQPIHDQRLKNSDRPQYLNQIYSINKQSEMSITQHCFLHSNLSESEIARSNQQLFKSLNSKERQEMTVVPFSHGEHRLVVPQQINVYNMFVKQAQKDPLQAAVAVSCLEIVQRDDLRLNQCTDMLNTSQNELTPLKLPRRGKDKRLSMPNTN